MQRGPRWPWGKPDCAACWHRKRSRRQKGSCRAGSQPTSLAQVSSLGFTQQPQTHRASWISGKAVTLGQVCGSWSRRVGNGPKVCTHLLKGDPEICVKPEVRVWTPPCVNYGAELVGRTRTALPCCFLASCVLSTNSPAVPLGTVLIFYIACEATNEKKKKRIEHTETNCKILTWEVETDMKYSGGSCCALCFPAVPHKDPRHFLL